MATAVRFEPAQESDFERLFEIRMMSVRDSLQRIGRFDPERGRLRFRTSFRPEFTRLIVSQAGKLLGCVAFGPRDGLLWLEHFYLLPEVSGQGIGTFVIKSLLAESDAQGLPVRLDVVRESEAKRFYERFGFVETHRDAIDVFMERPIPPR